MKTIFRAFGPNFKMNFTTEPFDSIHIYPLMCKLLQIEPAPHNGSLNVTENLLVFNGEFTFSSDGLFSFSVSELLFTNVINSHLS